MLRLRQPKFVLVFFFFFNEILSSSLHTYFYFEKTLRIHNVSSCEFQICRTRVHSPWHSRVEACVHLLKISFCPRANHVWLLIFQDMHHCAPLRMGKPFLHKRKHYIYKKGYMPTVSWIFTAKTPQDNVSMIDS